MSGILKVGGSELINDNGGSGALQWGSGVPQHTIIQVVNVPFNDQLTITGTTPGDVKEFDALTITSGSKLLIQLNCNVGGNSNTRLKYVVKLASGDSYTNLSSTSGIGSNTLSAQSGSNAITADEIIINHQHPTVQYFSNMTTSCHLIGPITSTYFRLKLQLYSIGSETSSVNRRVADTSQAGRSYMTFMEIAQ